MVSTSRRWASARVCGWVCDQWVGGLSATAAAAAALTLLFEGEVLCEMPTLVIAPEEEESVGVVDLEAPQEQHTLERHKRERKKHRS